MIYPIFTALLAIASGCLGIAVLVNYYSDSTLPELAYGFGIGLYFADVIALLITEFLILSSSKKLRDFK